MYQVWLLPTRLSLSGNTTIDIFRIQADHMNTGMLSSQIKLTNGSFVKNTTEAINIKTKVYADMNVSVFLQPDKTRIVAQNCILHITTMHLA